MITTICNIYNYSDREKQLLPHFIKHYRDKLNTYIIFCCDSNNHEFHDFCIDNSIIYHTFDFEYDKIYGIIDSIRINNIKNRYKCWYIPTDLDEFIDFQSEQSIQNMTHSCIINNYKYISGYFLDRFISKDRILENIDPTIDISEQFPYASSFTKDILEAWDKKVCLVSPELDISAGHHDVVDGIGLENIYFYLPVNHYKWFGDILKLEKEKMLTRLKNQSIYYLEQKKLLEYFNYEN